MNPQYPVPNSSNFYFNPLNPAQNPNPNFHHPQFNWAPPPQFAPPPPPPPPPPPQSQPPNPLPDLPNSLSSLKTLIQSSNSTLQSFSSLLPSLSLSSNSLAQCPSNPHHWVPSNSLFLHSLSCPSALDIGPVVETLQYPKTLINDQHLIQDNKFVQPINDPDAELCFSIDDYVDFDSNYFYQDCPGVVSSLTSDASKRIFTLPGVLSVGCANFIGCGDKESVGFGERSVKVLPSEVWFIGREVEQWSDYPVDYSSSVGRAIMCVECVKECDLSMWIIENSPRFGVVVDAPMGSHMCILFRLCLKALVGEAARSYGSLLKSHIDDGSRNFNHSPSRFKCPVLVEVFRWLSLQLSILYGEMNSRSLIFAMFRHLLSKAALHASLFPLDRKLDQAYGNEQSADITRGQYEGNDSKDEGIFCQPIFVYQIAAGIAALHERSLLEKRIRALRHPPQLTPYQRLSEHSYFSKKADEERQKRPDYRPLLEHDGLLNHRRHDKGTNKPKTKEELLAEERDYKRRRMSYRGKKLKRSTKEVMRDIIEDYMEAIKHTGGIGGPANGDHEKSLLTSTNSSDPAGSSSKLKYSSQSDPRDDYRTLLDDDRQYHDTEPIHASTRPERQEKESYNRGHSEDQRAFSRDRRYRGYSSRSPSTDRRRSHSRERRSQSRNQVVRETNEDEHSKRKFSSSNRSSHHDYNSSHRDYNLQTSASRSIRVSCGRKDKRRLASPDRQRREKHKYGRSDSFGSVEINDRYDPSETSHYDDRFDDSKYSRPTS